VPAAHTHPNWSVARSREQGGEENRIGFLGGGRGTHDSRTPRGCGSRSSGVASRLVSRTRTGSPAFAQQSAGSAMCKLRIGRIYGRRVHAAVSRRPPIIPMATRTLRKFGRCLSFNATVLSPRVQNPRPIRNFHIAGSTVSGDTGAGGTPRWFATHALGRRAAAPPPPPSAPCCSRVVARARVAAAPRLSRAPRGPPPPPAAARTRPPPWCTTRAAPARHSETMRETRWETQWERHSEGTVRETQWERYSEKDTVGDTVRETQ
jgi:hypothetical protein